MSPAELLFRTPSLSHCFLVACIGSCRLCVVHVRARAHGRVGGRAAEALAYARRNVRPCRLVRMYGGVSAVAHCLPRGSLHLPPPAAAPALRRWVEAARRLDFSRRQLRRCRPVEPLPPLAARSLCQP